MTVTNNMMRIDPHVHTSGVSLCGKVPFDVAIDNEIGFGFNGMILTNHCQSWYYPQNEHGVYVKKVVDEWKEAKRYGEKKKFKVFLGIEVTITDPMYNDWLIYGIDEDFLLRSPCLYALNQKSLFEFCRENKALLIQAHPLRNSGIGDPEYMNGLEINCTEGDAERADKVIEFAEEHKLMLTCGTDYHGKERSIRGGIYVPNSVSTNSDLKSFFGTEKYLGLFFGEREIKTLINR